MESHNKWHIPTGLFQMLPLKSHGKCKWDRIQTGCFPAACPNSGDPLVQWLKIKPAFRYRHLLDLRFLCLRHSWGAREGYFPNQLFLGTSFGSSRAFEFLPNPLKVYDGQAHLMLSNSSVLKLQGVWKQSFLLQIKKCILSKLSQSHNTKPQDPNPPWKLQGKLPHATNNFKDTWSACQTLYKLQTQFSLIFAHLWTK